MLCKIVTCSLLLGICLFILQQLQSTVFGPLCALPIFHSSDICRAMLVDRHWCASAPFISSSNWCRTVGQNTTRTTDGAIIRLSPAAITNMHELLAAVDGLTLGVNGSSLRRDVTLDRQLRLVVETADTCKNDVQDYVSQLSGALKIVSTSGRFTASIAESPGWLPGGNWAELRLAFYHTLQSFDSYIHELSRSGNQSVECISTLDAYMYATKDILGEAMRLAEQEIIHLLRVWWGNQTLLADTQSRLRIVSAARVQAQTIHKMIWDAQAPLKELVTGTEALKTFALQHHHMKADDFRVAIVAFMGGCQNIESTVEGRVGR
ncbi:hypothetical protein C8F04DRAFT_1204941 [Mycena alexandri]|uniref:Uncharacterized protein n=1 Tax=Mycena alexandri TaxID=1745969 RepID=A0AAD6RVA3_9AGAR|nr:hypothetical protein C8F04DRAFT_1204941 [Mycena alexandri]